MLVIGVGEDDPLYVELQRIAPTITRVPIGDSISDLRQRDYDAVVLSGDFRDIEPGIWVLQFGSGWVGQVQIGKSRVGLFLTGRTVAREFDVPDDLDPSIAALVRSTLAQDLPEAKSVAILQKSGLAGLFPVGDEVVCPFMLDPDKQVVAGRYDRPDPPAEWWFLPDWVSDRAAWLRAAFGAWGAKAPDAFPSEGQWMSSPEWMTERERAATAYVEAIEEDWRAEVARYEEHIQAARKDLANATEAANVNERRLLTAQDETLKSAVHAALVELGFTVEDVDLVPARKGDLLEDLRIQDVDEPGWIALAEVRGYSRGGAQSNDLLRIGHFVTRYLRENGVQPSAAWYIVNHSIRVAPGAREGALSSKPEDVEIFAQGGGVVIDTRDLFTLVKDVQAGTRTKVGARATLRAALGRLDLE